MNPRKGITGEQVLACIRDYQTDHGWPPTMQELADCLNISKSTAHEWVGRLVEKGQIVKGPGARAIRLP